jgi:anti-sigma factor (TIGR02949 family)
MNHKHDLGCRSILENLNAYIDGELDSELCSQIEAHISTCENCQIVVNTLKKTIEICQVTGRETKLPPEMRYRLYAQFNLDDYVEKD